MSEIRMDDGTIQVGGEWLTTDDLAKRIQEKIQSGDTKFTNLAAALEELQTVLEKSHILEVKLVITKDEYEKLRARGGEDDRESVRKAIMEFVGGSDQQEPVAQNSAPPKLTINCPHPQCMLPIEITTDDRPIMVECSNCGISGWLTAENKWGKPDKT